ncbi:hypothetical protein IMG5_065980 [Ichthyophthirius multifiliis]|uniref:Uncharacterized protein n=1 Tax=Ichthyophthirius multifiliis TaxID=5932 RepID=G0QPA5_ICHMU|nr:hypothetical protein IMG5_065980 [Ichthyophthirius multifiliis]EGR32942.1 hypothetical protein IMG5_065980 [Ichthyophthirius multifiliis]|eukprot:XP_004036928.1 hypothetical protein IMG5_065980 [Ichthyophthirius multifiliis]
MPPKKAKKVDPEVLQQQFDQWKSSPEYEQIKKMALILEEQNITETTKDFTGEWYPYLNQLYDFFKFYKIKTGKLKEFKHEQIRSTFFAQKDEENIKYQVDGIYCGVAREHQDNSYHCRHKFVKIMNYIKELDDLNPETLQPQKKLVIGFMKEFISFFQKHIKNDHDLIYNKQLAMTLQPLTNLIDINNQYKKFNITFVPIVEKVVRNFMSKVIIDKYIDYLQEIFRILWEEYQQPIIPILPDCHRLFYKLQLQYDKEKNKIESLYLNPLHSCFNEMSKTLLNLQVYGINYWKTPLNQNTKLIDDIQNLINADIIAEKLLGNPLKRDQLNFVYQVVGLIAESDEKIKENLLNRDENITSKAIPLLIIFKQIQRMLKWKLAKKEREEQMRVQSEKLQILTQLKNEESLKSPLKIREEEKKIWMEQQALLLEQQKKLEASLPPAKNAKGSKGQKGSKRDEAIYGRYFILENLMDEKDREEFEQSVEMLRHVNEAVQQDMQDFYIQINNQALKKKLKKNKNQVSYFLELSEKQNADIMMNVVRPPEMWNYPKIIEENHRFRCIAKPSKCYEDHRIDDIDRKINNLAEKLYGYRRFTWKEIVERVIDVYANKYNEKPTVIDPKEDPNWIQPDPSPHEIQVQRNREIKAQQLQATQALIEAAKTSSQTFQQEENKEKAQEAK